MRPESRKLIGMLERLIEQGEMHGSFGTRKTLAVLTALKGYKTLIERVEGEGPVGRYSKPWNELRAELPSLTRNHVATVGVGFWHPAKRGIVYIHDLNDQHLLNAHRLSLRHLLKLQDFNNPGADWAKVEELHKEIARRKLTPIPPTDAPAGHGDPA